jgi:iron transport multicopper oxidase
MKVTNPEENGETEMAPPDNVLFCGALASKQQYVSETIS